MEQAQKLEMYHLERLPSERWRRLGVGLILNPQVKHIPTRFAEWHFRYKGGGSNLLVVAGPPGVGKTDWVRVAADAAVRMLGPDAVGNGLVVSTASLFDHLLGESAKRIEALMAHITLSASKGPTVVIFNDAEGLFMSRKQSLAGNDSTDLVRVATTLFQGLDDLRGNPNVIMFATLNLTEALDEALLSRKAYILTVALPTCAERRAILANELAGIASERLLHRLAEASEGKSGRDLVGLKQQAFLHGTGRPDELREVDILQAVGLTPEPMSSVTETPPELAITDVIGEKECQWHSSLSASNNGYPPVITPPRSKLTRLREWFSAPQAT
jgi:SpoVK/Ycf46/Vps4 family AAA+-type ATPase